MSDRVDRIESVDVPDPAKLTEHGVSIDAPTPSQFAIPDPWTPSNGQSGAPSKSEPEPAREPEG